MFGHHITFYRANTMLVMATAEGTYAKRDVFMKYLAGQLEFANGMTPVSSMIELCSKEMSFSKDELTRPQAPFTYSMMRQPLILPAAKKKQLQAQEDQSSKKKIQIRVYSMLLTKYVKFV